jgi:hypothetical protein
MTIPFAPCFAPLVPDAELPVGLATMLMIRPASNR